MMRVPPALTVVPRGTTTSRTRDSAAWPLLGAEAALAALSVVAILNMRRLFEDWSFAAPFLVAALAGHLVAALFRRWRC